MRRRDAWVVWAVCMGGVCGRCVWANEREERRVPLPSKYRGQLCVIRKD